MEIWRRKINIKNTMKNLIVLFITVSLFTGCAFGTEVPPAVKTAFDLKFAGATDIKWGKENKTEFEADFKLNGIVMSANFKEDGTWMETETTVSAMDIPAVVTSAIKAKYPNAIINGGEIKERAGKDMVYEVAVKGIKGMDELVVSADGSSISDEEEEED